MAGGTWAVTGAFGYSGRAIARLLLGEGRRVRNLTGHPHRPDPFGERVEVVPWRFDDPAVLREALRGVEVLFNTYWIRFPRGTATHGAAVRNSRAIFAAAREAGVRRVVHTSITNPSAESRLSYFRGKAAVEAALRESGVSHAILRPAVLFGERDVLVNNIAWVARRLPVVGVPRGEYGLQPMHVGDFARLAVEQAAGDRDTVLDAVGPETFPYRDLVARIAAAVGTRPRILGMPRWAVRAGAMALGAWTGDLVLTREEIDGLAEDLLVSKGPPTGTTRLTDWLAAERDGLGREWAHEIDRHFR